MDELTKHLHLPLLTMHHVKGLGEKEIWKLLSKLHHEAWVLLIGKYSQG